MAINEKQLETWANPGSLAQSANTYQSIKGVIEDKNAPYANRSVTSFLQGSYGNDTNIIGVESDVDIVLKCGSVYGYDLSQMTEAEQDYYKRTHDGADYRYSDFKREVGEWLQKQYGRDLDPGEKAMHIKPNGGRRRADVLPCINFRRYQSFNGDDDPGTRSHKGICFYLPDNTRIENFPVQHRDNCTAKNQETKTYFKSMVRVVKNMRNRMVDEGMIAKGIAPSYFIEGFLFNLPSELYGHSYERSFLQFYNYMKRADSSKLLTASKLHWLVRKGQRTSWDKDNFDTFFSALGDFWDNF